MRVRFSRAVARYIQESVWHGSQRLEDRLEVQFAVVNLSADQPPPGRFLQAILRELKIRFYQPKSLKTIGPVYGASCDGSAGHITITARSRQSPCVRASGSRLFCGRQITLGLLSPRRPKTLPVVLSEEEVMRLLDAAPSLRDKLLLGLMYATGLRVSEEPIPKPLGTGSFCGVFGAKCACPLFLRGFGIGSKSRSCVGGISILIRRSSTSGKARGGRTAK